jgi:hypothetical protein
MRNSLNGTRQENPGEPFRYGILFGILTTLLGLASYGYLGIFSRYAGDDYCLSAFYFQKGNLFTWMVDRYVNHSSRYTNILFIGLVDKLLGWYNVAILPPLMIALFVWGLYLFLNEIVKLFSLGWNRLVLLFLSALVVYFSIVQAPALYETLYWRAGMTSHFAPLVFLPFLGAFLVYQIRIAKLRPPSVWILVADFVVAFMLGGLSEPPVALVITILCLAIVAGWWLGDPQSRRSNFVILFSALAGSFLALIVLALSPANSIRLETAPPSLLELIIRTFQYPSFFIADAFQSFPLPTVISILLPSLLFLGLNSYAVHADSKPTGRRIMSLMVLVLLLAYLFIAASFAPSVYGQSYPIPRARFAARVILSCALMMEGGLIGILINHLTRGYFQQKGWRYFVLVALLLLSLYPIRTALRNSVDFSVYQSRASAWDLRDAEIRKLKADGVQDIVVPFLSKEVIQDLGDHAGFRLNRCAASIYGVQSILAKTRH